jgi:hypothetical protein
MRKTKSNRSPQDKRRKMNTLSMKVKKFAIIALAVSIVAGLVGMALPTGSVAAASTSGGSAQAAQPAAVAPGAKADARLERAFKQEQTVQARQGKVLDRANLVIQKASAAIEKLKQAGKDVTFLEKILDAFKASVDSARLIHDQAAGIINAHPGFDANGTVTGRLQAQQTVKDVHGLLVQFRQSIWPAIRDLVKAVRTYRQNNKPAAVPTPGA